MFGDTSVLGLAAAGVPFLADELIDAKPWDPLLGASIVVAVAAVPLVVKIGIGMQRRRTERLRREFGDDYAATVVKHGNWRVAERELLNVRRNETQNARLNGASLWSSSRLRTGERSVVGCSRHP